jgi:glycosyltransferase involved in cell wall biosynthesis
VRPIRSPLIQKRSGESEIEIDHLAGRWAVADRRSVAEPPANRTSSAWKVCFVGGGRYAEPLSESDTRRFASLRSLCQVFVLGFAKDRYRPRLVADVARFYLLPDARAPLLRYAEMAILGPMLISWLVWRHGVDVIVAQSPYAGAIAVLVKGAMAWMPRAPVVVVESHGDFQEAVFLYRRVVGRALYRRLMRAAARFAVRRADVLRGVSDYTRRQLRRVGGGSRCVQFPAWTDLDLFVAAGAQRISRGSGDILFAGVIAPIKGVHHLVGAFAGLAAEVEGARLILAGRDTDGPYVARLRARVRALRLHERVLFVGEVPQRRLAELMAACGVFVLPSLSEGLGRVVIEAMATGAPVVATRVGGIAEVITDGVTGWLVAAGDEQALQDRLRHAVVNRPEAEAVGERARQWVAGHVARNGWLEGYARILAIAADLRRRGGGSGRGR